jgi:hypothetical protein
MCFRRLRAAYARHEIYTHIPDMYRAGQILIEL